MEKTFSEVFKNGTIFEDKKGRNLTKMRVYLISFLIIITSAFFTVSGQVKVAFDPENPAKSGRPIQFFPLSELKEGMTGTAQTVFSGSKPTGFNVEILGIVPDAIGPNQDMIVGRLSGGGADRTHVFAGMSGSPVYIDGKLVGAIAYAFPFAKEPICGITPIEQMIEIFENNREQTGKPKTPKSFSFSELASVELPGANMGNTAANYMLKGRNSSLPVQALAGQTFQPIATPMTFSGFSQETLNQFAPQLMSAGLMPVSALGGPSKIGGMKKADENTLLGGDSVVMQLTRGDYSLSAAGTVTLRAGEKIYAFGHPFLSLGVSDLPMSESHVVTVVPNVNNSFKLSVPDAMVGSMTQDRATGVFGKLGEVPGMIPVNLKMRTSRNLEKAYNFEVAKDDFLTPLLVNIAVYNSIVANERTIGSSTVQISGEIKLKGNAPVNIERRYGGSQASQYAAASVSTPIAALLQGRFDDLDISGIEIELRSDDDSRSATLERVGVNRSEVRAGEAIEIQAVVRSDSGKMFIQKIPVVIPADTPPGTLTITLGDGNSVQFMSAATKFTPNNVGELVQMLNELKKNDRLYVQIHRVTKGAVIGASELPNLPPSVLATINNTRTAGGVEPTVQSLVLEEEIPPADFLISGRQTISIEVVK
ncbi:MAG: hypothetical protein R2681_11505 [Pyrinomonadaceae bacterium]